VFIAATNTASPRLPDDVVFSDTDALTSAAVSSHARSMPTSLPVPLTATPDRE